MEWTPPDRLNALSDYLVSKTAQKHLQYRQTDFPSPSVYEEVLFETRIIDLPSWELFEYKRKDVLVGVI